MTIPLIRQAITELGTVLTEQENKASDLWSWLPSYRAASRAHGDRASDFRPSVIGVVNYPGLKAGACEVKSQNKLG